jgi:diaminopimelate decarboxylase
LDALDQRDVLPLGLQLHCGSNLDSLERLSASLKIHRTSVQAIFTRNPNAWLDLGGGFPARTLRKHYSPPSFTQQALALRQLLSQEDIDPNQHHLILEPGRCLVEDFGVFVTTVLSVKKRQDKSMVMLDASQSLISSSLRWHHDFIFLEDSCVPCDIYGSHCFEHDILAQDVQMPAQLKRGDLCLITGVGAYDLSYAHGWTRPRPPTLFIDKGFDQGAFHLSSLC